ncbi:hypothetical protein D8674_034652 [Pyrus ussuriensis x Pyrus communis]|uniref:Uncharacterized protein n=1 Tax=Pyrus ussuriensis x Pyrus communis TaxID=2448454 RepID=A0A5N5GAA4_9ROSA|nr:hypothetical protein D8674_034652 [Pyrus ussuriensis x Pyrus communis]
MPSCDGFRNGNHSEWSSAAMNSATMSTENPFECTPAKFVQNSTQDTDPTRDLAFDLSFSRQFMALSERGRDWALWAVTVYHCV